MVRLLKRLNQNKNKCIAVALSVIMGTTLLAGAVPVIAGLETASGQTNTLIVETAKTAVCTDPSTRTYNLQLSAWAEGSEQVEIPTKNDIVLVLDRSGSMDKEYSRKITREQYSIAANPVTGGLYYVKDGNEVYNQIVLQSNIDSYVWSYRNILGTTVNPKGGTVIYKNKYNFSNKINYSELAPGTTYYVCPSIFWYELNSTPVYSYYYINDSGNQIALTADQIYTKTDVTETDTTTRILALKEAAATFVDSMKTVAPDTRIDVVSFSSYDYGAKEVTNDTNGFKRISVSEEYNSIKNAINGLNALGATKVDSGMNMAYNLLNTSDMKSNGRSKTVIVFSDGIPTANSSYEPPVANAAITSADNIKNLGAKVYSIGLLNGLSKRGNPSEYSLAKDFLPRLASVKEDGTGAYFYEADENFDLTSAFKAILSDINKDLKGVVVKDYIDPRFELTQECKDSLSGIAGASYGIDASGVEYVEWENVTIPNSKEPPAWTGDISIRAKDDFVGGNAVPTNTTNSGIYVNDSLYKAFPVPTVNVAVAENNLELSDTLFYGDTISSVDIKDKMFRHALSNDTRLNTSVNELLLTRTVDYVYPGTEDVLGTLSLELSDNSDFNSLEKPQGTGDTPYLLKVIYTPYSAAERSEGTTPTLGTGEVTTSEITVVSYEVNVVKGELTIIRTIDQQCTNSEEPFSNQSFVYEIERYGDVSCSGDPQAVFYTVLSFSANNTVTTASSTIKGLQKGYYKVSEESSWSYKYDANIVNAVFIGEQLGNGFFGQEGETGNLQAATVFNGLKKSILWLSDEASMVIR